MSNGIRIAIIGGGNLGLYLAGHLSLAGNEVFITQRTRSTGSETDIIFAEGDEHWHASQVRFTVQEELQGPFNQVIVAVKSHDLQAVLPRLAELGDADTCYVFLQNGIPWWWTYRDGDIAGAPKLANTVAVVVQHAVERLGPKRIKVHSNGRNRYICAQADNENSARLQALITRWRQADIPAESSNDIRSEVWTKLMANATLNPLSAITGATLAELAGTPQTRTVLSAGMNEIARLAELEGSRVRMPPQAWLRFAEEIGTARTSMLQDRLAGRTLETEALLAAPIALAERYGEPVPILKTLLGCLSIPRTDLFRSAR